MNIDLIILMNHNLFNKLCCYFGIINNEPKLCNKKSFNNTDFCEEHNDKKYLSGINNQIENEYCCDKLKNLMDNFKKTKEIAKRIEFFDQIYEFLYKHKLWLSRYQKLRQSVYQKLLQIKEDYPNTNKYIHLIYPEVCKCNICTSNIKQIDQDDMFIISI